MTLESTLYDERKKLMPLKPKMSITLWFDTEAEDAAKFYTSIFKDSKMGHVQRYTKEGFEIHGKPAGTVMVAEFEVNGLHFTALNGGPHFKFNEAISFVIPCETQDDIDYYWSKLGAGGSPGQCGWLKDKYGLSWQVVPTVLSAMMSSPDSKKVQRVTKAFLKMQKFDLAALKRAFEE